MDAKHLWFYSYLHQIKKPHPSLQPKLPYLLFGLTLSKWISDGFVSLHNGEVSHRVKEPFSSIIKKEYTSPIGLIEEMAKNDLHFKTVKRWEKESYFTIEERRFGSMVSRLYHLKPKSHRIFEEIKKSKSNYEIFTLSKEQERFIAYVLLAGDVQRLLERGDRSEVMRIHNEYLEKDAVYQALHEYFSAK